MIQPSCIYGYTEADLIIIFGDRLPDFYKWMRGQTISLCDGRVYDHDLKEYIDSKCGPPGHGPVYYPWDVKNFIDPSPWLD